ncbi:MAG: ABC transporter ATP-binding protein [Rectinemataceae bacterium]
MDELLRIEGLSTSFFTRGGEVRAVDGISLSVKKGEILGIVGESGSGKSVCMMSVMRLIPEPPGRITAGKILFGGQDLLALGEDEMERIRGARIAMIFQDPMTSLNPTLTVGFQIMEALKWHLGLSGAEARKRATELLAMVNIPDPAERLAEYPHRFSGGMRQRVMIALALACDPELLIADEPTTALDVTIQAQIIELVQKLQRERGMGVIWITHDLGVVARLADRVMVTYAGSMVESAAALELFERPGHPYTFGLLSSLPSHGGDKKTALLAIPGQPPNLVERSPGCPFAPRCSFARQRCMVERPPFGEIAECHSLACWEYQAVRDSWKGQGS